MAVKQIGLSRSPTLAKVWYASKFLFFPIVEVSWYPWGHPNETSDDTLGCLSLWNVRKVLNRVLQCCFSQEIGGQGNGQHSDYKNKTLIRNYCSRSSKNLTLTFLHSTSASSFSLVLVLIREEKYISVYWMTSSFLPNFTHGPQPPKPIFHPAKVSTTHMNQPCTAVHCSAMPCSTVRVTCSAVRLPCKFLSTVHCCAVPCTCQKIYLL